MKIRTGLAFLVAFTLVSRLPAPPTNFNGSDDFSSANPSNWGTTISVNGGNFTTNFGDLNYVDPGLDTSGGSQSATATLPWILNQGSYDTDWSVQMDFSLNMTLMPAEYVRWALILQSSIDGNDYLVAGMARNYMQTAPNVQALVYTDNTVASNSTAQDLVSSITATLLVSYSGSTHTFNSYYDGNGATGGYAFTPLWTTTVPGDWNMTSGSTFNLLVQANHQAMASSTFAVVEGAFTADDFLATPTAVPEPATLALLAGFAALGFSLWRRRAA